MSKENYIKSMKNIKASDSFKKETLLILEEEAKYKNSQTSDTVQSNIVDMKKYENERNSKKMNLSIKKLSLIAACGAIIVGAAFFTTSKITTPNKNNVAIEVPKDNGETLPNPDHSGSIVANIQGKITEISKDGKSYKLDTGLWVDITEKTTVEGTPKVGDRIGGITRDDINGERVTAKLIFIRTDKE